MAKRSFLSKVDKKIIIENYRDRVSFYEDFANTIAIFLKILLKNNNFFFQTILHRAKTADSLEDKINDPDSKLNIRKFSDIQDLAGVRVIFYLKSDIERFIPNIYKEFGEKNILKHQLRVDESGYEAVHLVIRLNKDRLKLLEYSKFKDLKCEIQLTTTLNHTWAEMSNKFIYKRKRELLNFDKHSFEILKKYFREANNYIKEASAIFEVTYYKFNEIQKGKDVFDIRFLKNISTENSNNTIYRQLELLEKYTAKFGNKVPKESNIIRLLTEIIKKSKINKIKKEKTIFGNLPGKTYSEIVVACLKILNNVRYTDFLNVFNLLTRLYQEPDENIKNEVKEVLEKLVEYNFNILKKKEIGYIIQRTILDSVIRWEQKEKIRNIEIIKFIGNKLLEPGYSGKAMSDWNKTTISFGALVPTFYLEKIRKDTIDLFIDLYMSSKDQRIKISLLKVLKNVLRYPSQGDYSKVKNKIEKMITSNAKYLIKFYENIVVKKGSKVVTKLAILEEIEDQLNWLDEVQRKEIIEVNKLLEKIKKNRIYYLYRLFVGKVYEEARRAENWQKMEKNREKEIDIEFNKINKKNINNWSKELNLIAKNRNIVDEWKFSRFQDFLQRIAREKPELAKIVLDDSFENNKPLKAFIGHFLFGFRQSNSLKIWDGYVKKIIKEKNIDLVKDISNSFFYVIDSKKNRKKDIDLLSQIIKKEKPFDFLKKAQKGKLRGLNYSLIRVLTELYRKNKKQIEGLIIKLIKEDKEKQYLYMYLEQLGFPVYRNEIDLSGWYKKNIKLILGELVELKDLSYNSQLLLLSIAKDNFSLAMNVFVERIRKREKMGEERKGLISSIEYDAIPYHFNDKLSGYINQQTETVKIIEDWAKKMSSKGSVYNMELAQFFQKIGGSTYDNVLSKIIKNGKESDLKTAIKLMWGINFSSRKFCFEIVKKTKNKKIWRDVGGLIFNTGVVHGEYGLADAYKSKAERIKAYKTKGTQEEIERVEKFKIKIIKDLQEAAKRETQRADEEIQLRKLEFEE